MAEALISMPGAVTRGLRPASDEIHAIDALLLPTWYADLIKRRKRETTILAERRRMQTDPAYREERERQLRDTKPLMVADTSDRHRPIFVVGGGGMWRGDMQEKAARLKERPNPAHDPDRGTKRNVKEDISVAVDRRLRGMRGHRTFHIKNNPVGREVQ